MKSFASHKIEPPLFLSMQKTVDEKAVVLQAPLGLIGCIRAFLFASPACNPVVSDNG
jgi:hypothetical protein